MDKLKIVKEQKGNDTITRTIRISGTTFDKINELAEILKNDGVISVPTDTVYGLCAKINSEEAYKKLVRY